MEASVVDLRYKMKEVLEALERRETVRLLYHGKVKGEAIVNIKGRSKGTSCARRRQPFFGMKAKVRPRCSKE